MQAIRGILRGVVRPPVEYAAERPWPFPAPFDLARWPVLARCRDFSTATLARIREHLADLATRGPDVVTVAVAGSLGRLEAMSHSDCDLMVVVSDEAAADPQRARRALDSVWAMLAPLDLKSPRKWGIFVSPTSRAELCDPAALGNLEESKNVFGKRMQILLDTQPVQAPQALRSLQRAILDWYATAFLARDPKREWTYLLNDLIRYFRSYCAWQQFELKVVEDGSWYVRNAKLRHSRLLAYAGLLLLLGECSGERQDKVGWLLPALGMTPMERIGYVYALHNDERFLHLLDAVERFTRHIEQPEVRAAFVDKAPRALCEVGPPYIEEFGTPRETAAAILGELVRFVLARRGDWSQRFFEYLLF